MSDPGVGFGALIRLEYNYPPGPASSRYLRSIS